MALNIEQKIQVERQLSMHGHENFRTDYLAGNMLLKGLSIHAKVHRPDIMGGSHVMANFLAGHPEFYKGLFATDMGCGSGVLGVVMGKNGAYRVVMADNSRAAYANAKENIGIFGLGGKASAIESDLFSHVRGKSHLIVFNHPFFPGDPKDYSDSPAAATMLDEGRLLQRFLREAKNHLLPGGRILMPFFHLAGDANNPALSADRHGYAAREVFSTNTTDTIQKGKFSVYELKLKEHSDIAIASHHPILNFMRSISSNRIRIAASVIDGGRKALFRVESPLALDLTDLLRRHKIWSTELTSALNSKHRRIIVRNLDEPSAKLINALSVMRDEKNQLRRKK